MILKLISASVISLVLIFSITPAKSEDMPRIVGVYSLLPGEDFRFDGKKVEIVEFMSFYCHTCYNFEQSIPVIKGNFPKKITWKVIPIHWGDHGSPKPGEAYLIAREMGKGEAMKKAIFTAQMRQKKDIADVTVLEALGKEIGLGPEFSKQLRSGAKAQEIQESLALARKVGISETPTIVIAGNIKTDPHPMNHDLNTFRTNIMAIVHSILKSGN
jgi:protein-disulfide isomerase